MNECLYLATRRTADPWTYMYQCRYGNRVERNHLSQLAQTTRDLGGLSFIGQGHTDTIVRHNCVRDVIGMDIDDSGRLMRPFYSWSVYLDNFATGFFVESNIFSGNVLGECPVLLSSSCRSDQCSCDRRRVHPRRFIKCDHQQHFLPFLQRQHAGARALRSCALCSPLYHSCHHANRECLVSQCDGSQGVLLGYMGPALANNTVTQNIIVSEATERCVTIFRSFLRALAELLTKTHNMTGSRLHSFTRLTTLLVALPTARAALLSTAICTHTSPIKPD